MLANWRCMVMRTRSHKGDLLHGSKLCLHRTSSRVFFQIPCTSAGWPTTERRCMKKSVTKPGCMVSRFSLWSSLFLRVWGWKPGASWWLIFSRVCANDSIRPSSWNCWREIWQAKVGKERLSRPFVLITDSFSGDNSKTSKVTSLLAPFLLTITAAFCAFISRGIIPIVLPDARSRRVSASWDSLRNPEALRTRRRFSIVDTTRSIWLRVGYSYQQLSS